MTKLTFCFDIDGTLCSKTDGDYEKAEPFLDRIFHLRQLFDAGNTVILFTARGSTTGIDWEVTTREQLKKWGVPFHELKFGKPYADIFVDDKAFNDQAYDWGRKES
jgi:CMP-N,N'-diacetyllegionaminic acid synthase